MSAGADRSGEQDGGGVDGVVVLLLVRGEQLELTGAADALG